MASEALVKVGLGSEIRWRRAREKKPRIVVASGRGAEKEAAAAKERDVGVA